MLDFVDITKDNIHWYCRFEKNFEDDLKNFRTEIYPANSDFFVPLIENKLLKWSYLFYGGRIIGAIWIEKEHSCLLTAQLGIFIEEKELRSQGIGRKAIDRYIQDNKRKLNLTELTIDVRKENIRAINCFKKCGFRCEQQYEDTDGTKIMKMINSL